jgi:hypothetical protein
MKDISLIMPFRERIGLFNTLMKTLKDTTKRPENIEILCACDYDDLVLLDAKERLINEAKPFDLQFHFTQRSEYFVRDYWNFVAKKVVGRWVMAINDDAEFETVGWDKMLCDRMKRKADNFGDDLIIGLINDCIPRKGEDPLYPHFSSWVLMGKEVIDALGYFYDERFYVWGVDHIVPRVFRAWCGNTRIVSLTDIVINHNHWHTGRREQDDNFRRMAKIHEQNDHHHTEQMEREEAEKLINYKKSLH